MNQNRIITEDSFLQACVADRRPISCWLGSGTRLSGTIVSADEHAIFMRPVGSEDDADVMMVYKLQIASVAPISAKNGSRLRPQYLRDLSADRVVGED